MKVFSLILVLCFIVLRLAGDGINTAYELFGLSLDGMGQGRVWELVSYGFLHGSWWHLTANTAIVILLGSKVQRILDCKSALTVTFFGVVLGGFMHLLMNVFLPENQQGLLVGISGGMMALLLCLTTLDPDHQLRPLRIRSRHLGLGFLLSSLLLALLTPSLGIAGFATLGRSLGEAFGSDIFYVSHACHFGGGIAGLFYGKYILGTLYPA